MQRVRASKNKNMDKSNWLAFYSKNKSKRVWVLPRWAIRRFTTKMNLVLLTFFIFIKLCENIIQGSQVLDFDLWFPRSSFSWNCVHSHFIYFKTYCLIVQKYRIRVWVCWRIFLCDRNLFHIPYNSWEIFNSSSLSGT